MRHLLNILNSTFASTVRGWRGTSCTRDHLQPEGLLYLFDREGDAECRLVREALTGLNLDVMIMPCPIGGRNIKQLESDSGSSSVPALFDSNTEERYVGAPQIINHLYECYKGTPVPESVRLSAKKLALSRISSIIRLNAGIKAKESAPPNKPLVLYSFESSPFSRVVRELLCELELPYFLINLGKQQRADMGPAKLRLNIGHYSPVKNSKREAFFQRHGNVQVPYLEDPNTGASLFESDAILAYLKREYAR
jgi:glutathione S-transferase